MIKKILFFLLFFLIVFHLSSKLTSACTAGETQCAGGSLSVCINGSFTNASTCGCGCADAFSCATCCSDNGVACSGNYQCCLGYCGDGFCADPPPACGETGDYCDSDTSCCSGFTCTMNECYAEVLCEDGSDGDNVCNEGSGYCGNICEPDGDWARVKCSTNVSCYNALSFCNDSYPDLLDVGPIYCPAPGDPQPTSPCHHFKCQNVGPGGVCTIGPMPPFPIDGACGDGPSSCDSCGGPQCVWCDGNEPPPGPIPTPGCTDDCFSDTRYPTTCYNDMFGICANSLWCDGKKPNECLGDVCVGETYVGTCGDSCDGTKVDESQTNCTGTQVQYTETPQTTGTIWAKATGCTSGVTSSVANTWNSYNVDDDIVSYSGTNKGGGTWQSTINISSHQPALGSTLNVHVYENGVCRPVGSDWEWVGAQTITLAPKTCAVTINTPGAVSSQASGINITATGNAHINPGSDWVRVWITRNDMGAIPGGVTYDYGGNTGIVAVNNGSNYYSLDSAFKNSVNAANTSATFTVHAPPGTYRVHCDLPNELNGNHVECSGNPNCDFNNGGVGIACGGWKDCSAFDNVSVCFAAPCSSPFCGQPRTCGLPNCGVGDTGTPSLPTVISPSLGSGTTITCTSDILLKWNPVFGVNDGYNVNITIGSSSVWAYNPQDAGTSAAWLPYDRADAVGTRNKGNYGWSVRAFNKTCDSYLGTKYSAYSVGYFCRECESCSPKCGQSRDCGGNCLIDETLTDCSAPTTQYIETPQTTGTVWARATGCSSEVTNFQFPTWNSYNDKDDIVWYDASNQGGGTWQSSINVASHQPLLGNPINIHAYDWGCNHTTSNKKYIGATSFSVVPKTCSVGVSNASATKGKGVRITTTGNAHINPGGDIVRSFVSKEGNLAIVDGVTYDYGGSTGISALLDGNNYYNLVNTNLTSINSNTTTSSYVVHAPPGTYRVHCDLPNELNGNHVECSGNPNCDFNNGGVGIACGGWKSCSSSDWATFTILPPPSLNGFTIRRGSDWNYMPKDSSNRSHTCDLYLADTALPRRVVYVAHVYNPAGFDNIGTVQIRWKGDGTILNMINMPEYNSGNNAVYYVVVDLGTDKNKNIAYGFEINMTNDDGDSNGWVLVKTDPVTEGTVSSNPALNVERKLKIWNCQVPVSGSLYDKTGISVVCPNWSGLLKSGPDVEFDALSFKTVAGTAVQMQVTSPNYNSPVGVGITWGKSYISVFNNGSYPTDPLDTLGDLLAFGIETRIIDLGLETVGSCPAQQFNIGTWVSPYSVNPEAQIDFSFVEDQEAWYQVVGAGVKSAGPFSYGVPVTADPPETKFLTLGNSTVYNGLVSATSFTNNNGNNNKDDLGGPGLPEPYKNWYVLRNTNDSDIYNYKYFYDNFYVKAGVGETKTSWGGWEKNKIYFVDGALNIATSSPVINPNSETFMVIVKGTIDIAPSVKRLDGIYIADGAISVGGTSVDQLNINGMLYAGGNINLSRSFTDKTDNNASPAVKVNYSPGLIFNLDPRVLRVLSGWREE